MIALRAGLVRALALHSGSEKSPWVPACRTVRKQGMILICRVQCTLGWHRNWGLQQHNGNVWLLCRWEADIGWNEAYAPNKRFGSFVDGAELFDSAFFSVAQPEAEAMDAQQRLLLESAYEAMRSSTPRAFMGATFRLSSSPCRPNAHKSIRIHVHKVPACRRHVASHCAQWLVTTSSIERQHLIGRFYAQGKQQRAWQLLSACRTPSTTSTLPTSR